MEAKTVDAGKLRTTVLALYDEAYIGADAAGGCWFTDGTPGSGLLDTLDALDTAAANAPLAGSSLSAAGHAAHLVFALGLAVKSTKGVNAFAGADWGAAWRGSPVDEASWAALRAELRASYVAYRTYLAASETWLDGMAFTGSLALASHAAWHLGALRQGLGLVDRD